MSGCATDTASLPKQSNWDIQKKSEPPPPPYGGEPLSQGLSEYFLQRCRQNFETLGCKLQRFQQQKTRVSQSSLPPRDVEIFWNVPMFWQGQPACHLRNKKTKPIEHNRYKLNQKAYKASFFSELVCSKLQIRQSRRACQNNNLAETTLHVANTEQSIVLTKLASVQ